MQWWNVSKCIFLKANSICKHVSMECDERVSLKVEDDGIVLFNCVLCRICQLLLKKRQTSQLKERDRENSGG